MTAGVGCCRPAVQLLHQGKLLLQLCVAVQENLQVIAGGGQRSTNDLSMLPEKPKRCAFASSSFHFSQPDR